LKIVLIGMPGAGKTTIGKMLSNKLNLDFYDCDEEIEKYANKKIKQIFEEDGEERFREIETRIIKELSKKDSGVISLGGGAILKKENIDSLKSDSRIIFLNRPLEKIISDIETEERPLLKNGEEALYNLYNSRIHLYKEYSNVEVVNDDTISKVVNEIIEMEGLF